MDNLSVWLEKILKWVARRGVPGIPYIGKAPGGYRNPPAPHLELVYVLDKGIDRVSVGDQVVSIPPYHLAIHNVQQALEFLSLHYRDSSILLNDIARAAALETHHFGRVFRQHLGMSPMRYLRNMRLQHPRHLLRDTSMRVEEVAFSVGFNDPLYFSRVFRTATGLSPTAWRTGQV